MKLCNKCYHPATDSRGLCPYHGGMTIREILKQRGVSRSAFAAIMGISNRTIDHIHSGKRQLSEIELRGLLSLEKER